MGLIKILVQLTNDHVGTVVVLTAPDFVNTEELLKMMTVLISYTVSFGLQSNATLLMSQVTSTICGLYGCNLINAHDYTDKTETFTGIIKTLEI